MDWRKNVKFVSAILAGSVLLATTAAYADDLAGNPEVGEKVFKKCKVCHAFEGKNRVGPHLDGVVGRPVASVPDFKYSDAMKEFGADGKVWSREELTIYLRKPKDLVKGTKMAFAGLKEPHEIADVIAYLEEHPAGE